MISAEQDFTLVSKCRSNLPGNFHGGFHSFRNVFEMYVLQVMKPVWKRPWIIKISDILEKKISSLLLELDRSCSCWNQQLSFEDPWSTTSLLLPATNKSTHRPGGHMAADTYPFHITTHFLSLTQRGVFSSLLSLLSRYCLISRTRV